MSWLTWHVPCRLAEHLCWSLSLRDQADRASCQRALLYYSRKKEMWRTASFMFLPESGTYHVHSHCISQVSHMVMTHIGNGGKVTVHFHRQGDLAILSELQQLLSLSVHSPPCLSSSIPHHFLFLILFHFPSTNYLSQKAWFGFNITLYPFLCQPQVPSYMNCVAIHRH